MINWILLGVILISPLPAMATGSKNCSTKCLRTETIETTTCGKDEGGALGGAGLGFLLGGPIGALIGAGAGSLATDTKCQTTKKEICAEQKTVCSEVSP